MSRATAAYEALFHAVREPCVLTSRGGLIEDVNAAAAALAGTSQDLLRGKPLVILVDPADRRLFRRALAHAAAGEPASTLLLTVRDQKGQSVAVGADCIVHSDRGGAASSFLWVLHPLDPERGAERADEILERFSAAQTSALRAMIETSRYDTRLLRRALDALPFGVLLLEPRSRDVILANQALLTMLGVARFERDALRTPAGEPLDESAWPVDRTLRTRLPVVDTRLSLLRPDGDVAVLDVRTTPVSERGRMQAVLATFVDLDARATQERADAEFVSNAAHNLRNPLTVISTAVEILQAGAKEDEAERDRFLAHIEREAARMLQLTRSLLTLSQADHGGEPPRWRAVPADELLRAVAAAVRPAQEVRLVVDTTPDVVAYTDAALLQQALANLAENAARHTRSGSIVLHGSRSNGGVLFRVTDTGDGIPGAGNDVFERGSSRELREDGFGLGLAIVRRIAEALSADLELESEVGVGTSVSLLVPFRGGGR